MHKSPLNSANVLLFLTAASYVLLNKKMDFSNLWFGVFGIVWLLLLSTMRLYSTDCSAYLYGVYYDHPFVKFLALSIYVMNILLISMYACTWIFCWSVCELLHVWYYLVGIEIFDFFVFVLFWVRIRDILIMFMIPLWVWSICVWIFIFIQMI